MLFASPIAASTQETVACVLSFACSLLVLLALPPAQQRRTRRTVDLALALGIDISGSIDPDEARCSARAMSRRSATR